MVSVVECKDRQGCTPDRPSNTATLREAAMPKRDSTTPPFTGYRIPDDGKFRTINFSGGRSSAYMLHQIWQAHDGVLPETCRVIFCNTGKEREETLEFVRRIGEAWNIEIVWLEYRYASAAKGGRSDPKNIHVRVDFESASRRGEPFEMLNRKQRMLPNPTNRICTAELKVATTRRYIARDLLWNPKEVKNVLGIRYDEPRRWGRVVAARCDAEMPMVHARVASADVMRFWARQPFDLGIPSRLGNCDLCFMRRWSTLAEAVRAEPERAEWWKEQEEFASAMADERGLRFKHMARFNKQWSYEDLQREAVNSPPLPMVLDAPGIDCFCTD